MASDYAIRRAAHLVQRGGVIVYPTETVYGLGCDPLNYAAVSNLCLLKHRGLRKGLILLANNIDLFNGYISPLSSEDAEKISQTDKPVSWIVPANTNTPEWLTGGRDSLLVRVTTHPVVDKLCRQLRYPLVSSSANPGGHKPALNAFQVHRYFHNRVDAILTSAHSSSGQPSAIRQLATGKQFR